jgi:hypothetical protein
LSATAAFAQDKVVLKTKLPPPLFVGTPVPLNVPNLEPPTKGKRPDFYGSRRHHQPGQEQEGHRQRQQSRRGHAGHDRRWRQGRQRRLMGGAWARQTMGADRPGEGANIYAVLVWHFHSQARVYRDVVVQVSDDPTFRRA